MLDSTVDTQYTATSLIPGQTYKFKVQSRNSVGFSPFSNEVSILAAQPPSTPEAPTTVSSADQIVVAWKQPYNGGVAITQYSVTFRQVDGVSFAPLEAYCDGSDADTIAQRVCYIPFTEFRNAPFELPWGASIYARVQATNIMGDSPVSASGNGGVITRISDPPANLQSDDGISNAVVIGMNWDAPAEDGGLEILDYRLWWD